MGLGQALPTQCAPPGSGAGSVPAVDGGVWMQIQPAGATPICLNVRRRSHSAQLPLWTQGPMRMSP
ncbi:hypothetical protein RAJCM14343_1328 [Rhodococcus aetherivorans]|uniref:Uncharacterized protein n=2 Tax=Rhodococcus TaxID=1827 RepID=A0A866W1H1_9NOCA|nr:hypothetical protein [Rhodococcus ruber]GES36079.1 hypothetical protein RAJCM14343_1328 [Rhodococcus aetherivorans]CCW10134.1 hypothetical protein EBESD8_6620 [Rhodococcus aetherivorans]